MQKSVLRSRMTLLYWSQPSSVVLCIQNSDFSTRIVNLYESQPSSEVLCIPNSDLRTKIACSYGSQTSPVVLCIQYSVICIRITSLYGSQPSCVVFGCKTASFGLEKKSLWVPDITRHPLCMQTSVICTRNISLYGCPSPHLWFGACKTTRIGPQLLVSMGLIPHLSFCTFQYNDWLASRITSHLWVPDHKLSFCCNAKQRDLAPELTSLYWFQPSSAVFFQFTTTSLYDQTYIFCYLFQTSSVVVSTHNNEPNIRIKRQYGFQPSPVVLCMQNCGLYALRITSLYCSQHLIYVFFAFKSSVFWTSKLHVSIGPRRHLWFSAC